MMRLINKIMGWGVWRPRTIQSGPLRGLREWRKRGWNYRAHVITPIEGLATLYFLRIGWAGVGRGGRLEVNGTAGDEYEARWVVDDFLAKEEARA